MQPRGLGFEVWAFGFQFGIAIQVQDCGSEFMRLIESGVQRSGDQGFGVPDPVQVDRIWE